MPDAFHLALARAIVEKRRKSDPLTRQLLEELSSEEAAKAVLDEKRRASPPPTKEGGQPAPRPAATQTAEPLGTTLHRLIHNNGPMLRSQVFAMALPIVGDRLMKPKKSMGNAISALIKEGKLEWVGDKKPRLIKSIAAPEPRVRLIEEASA